MSSSSDHKTETSAIEIRDLSYSYQNSREPVLSIQHWQIERGVRAFVHGSSGSGKTTLLNLLAGVSLPSRGEVRVLGELISAKKAAERDRFRANHIGVIFQQFNLIPWLSVRDNIAAAHHFSSRKMTKASMEIRAGEILDRLGIARSMLNRNTAALSVGQQQRVAIARALINEPELLIADEPTSSLDSNARDDFIKLLLECVSSQSSTLIFVSHDQSLAKHFDVQADLETLNEANSENVV